MNKLQQGIDIIKTLSTKLYPKMCKDCKAKLKDEKTKKNLDFFKSLCPKCKRLLIKECQKIIKK